MATCGAHDCTTKPLSRVLSTNPSGKYDVASFTASAPALKNAAEGLTSFGTRTTHTNLWPLSSNPHASSVCCSKLRTPPLPNVTKRTEPEGWLSSQERHSVLFSVTVFGLDGVATRDLNRVRKVHEFACHVTVQLWEKEGESQQVCRGGEKREDGNVVGIKKVENLGTEHFFVGMKEEDSFL
ncbi:hypothetical protein CR513_35391, partial [Mucuna pruriens]